MLWMSYFPLLTHVRGSNVGGCSAIREFKAVLLEYAEGMLARLPKPAQSNMFGETFTLTAEQLEIACVVVNTAEYCSSTVPQVCGMCVPRGCIVFCP